MTKIEHRKLTDAELHAMDAVTLYRHVLYNSVKTQFPYGYWKREDSLHNSKLIIRYLLEDTLHFTREEICERYSAEILYAYKLTGLLDLFDNHLYETLDNAYPNEFEPWEIARTPNGYWTKERIQTILKYHIEEVYGYKTKEDILKNCNLDFFKKSPFATPFHIYRGCKYDLLNCVYPNRFKPEDFNTLPHHSITREICAKELRDVIDIKLKLTREELLGQYNRYFLSYNKCSRNYVFYNGDYFAALDNAYPGEYKIWEIKNIREDFWDKNKIKDAIIWLLKDKLKVKKASEVYNIDLDVFKNNNLESMLGTLEGSIEEEIVKILPQLDINKFKSRKPK